MPIKITPKGQKGSIKIVAKDNSAVIKEEPVKIVETPIIKAKKPISPISIQVQQAEIVGAYFSSIESATLDELFTQLSDKWADFNDKPRATVCRWVIDETEEPFIDQFIEAENKSSKKTKDFFIKFITPFEDAVGYSEVLIDELKEQIKGGLELDDRPTYTDWEAWRSPSVLQGSDYFTQNLLRFFETVIRDLNCSVVAYIAPEEIADMEAWQHWIGRAIELKLPDRVCLMLVDKIKEPILGDLVEAFPVHLFNTKANLNVEGFFKSLNETEEPDEFTDLFVQLIQTPPGDSKMITQLEQRLIYFTEQRGCPNVRIVVHNIVGQKLIQNNLNEAAYKKHTEAREIANAIPDYEERGLLAEGLTAESLKPLFPDAVFSQAMACYETKEYELGAFHFEEAALLNRTGKNYIMEILSRQFGGICYERISALEKAWETFNFALDAGEQLEEKQRKDTPLAYIGNAMMKLTKSLNLGSSRVLVRQRMIELLGGDWEELLEETEKA